MQSPNTPMIAKPRWQPRSATLRYRSIFGLIGVDLASILVGFGVAIVARSVVFGDTNWQFLLQTVIPIYVLAAFNNHAYGRDNLHYPFRAVKRGLQALLIAISATVLIGFSLKASDSLPRTVAIFGFLLSSAVMFAGRYCFTRHFEAIIGGNPFNVIVLCDGDQPVPVGPFSIVMAADANFDPEVHDPVMYDRLAKTLQSADRVVVACSTDRRVAWANALKGISVQGEIIVSEFASLAPLGMASYGEVPTMVVSAGSLGLADRALKRAFDLIVAGLAILILSPLLFLVAALVKFDSRGPILFRQTRIGRDNELFEVLKFRSMFAATADSTGHRSVSRTDDRVTRIGRIIRSSSVDELPQLFNVLNGHMSIVGPRPHALGSRAADKLYWEVDQRYWHRHAAKPGLTGLAQVRGFRGATVVEADLANRLQADLEYLENWTLWRDIKIIMLTFRVLMHRNAF